MTKEKLKQYRLLKLELEDIEQKIHSQRLQDSVQGSMKEYPYVLRNKHIEGISREDEGLLRRKSDIKLQMLEIENFVKKIPNYKIRKAVQIYYINELDESCDKPTWEHVADKLNDGSTGDAIRVNVDRYFKNGILK